jgi:hypothetical protein
MTFPYPPSRLPSRRPWSFVLLLLAISASGCGEGIFGSREGDAIPRETFLAAIVELRLAAYRENNEGVLPAGAHEEILARHGVTAEQMTGFVEVHGRDIPFMDSVWIEIDGHVRAGLEARAAEGTTTSTPAQQP